MMRRTLIVLIVMVAASAAWAVSEETRNAERFSMHMLAAVGAVVVQCEEELEQQEDNRFLICAERRGDFDDFKSSWELEILRDKIVASRDGTGRLPDYKEIGPWKKGDALYGRHYRVDDVVIGVFHSTGRLFLLWVVDP